MADEKTTPTPKVGKTDTMHSSPDAPDRSKGGTAVAEEEAPQPKGITAGRGSGSVAAGGGDQQTIETEEAGTLVTDIPPLTESGRPAQTNIPNEAPVTPLAGESDEDFQERLSRQRDEGKARLQAAVDEAQANLDAFEERMDKAGEQKGATKDKGAKTSGRSNKSGKATEEDDDK